MGRHRGSAATRRARATAYVVGIATAAGLAGATPAPAQSTGGVSPDTAPTAPPLSDPPPGVIARPAPVLRSWRCVRDCQSTTTGAAGSLLRLRGRSLTRTFEVVFLGGPSDGDDVTAAPVRRTRKVVTVRVPLGAVAGPLLVADRDGQQSAPSVVPLTLEAPVALKLAGAPPAVEVQAQARRAFFDAARPAKVSYVVHGDTSTDVVVELLRARDRAVVTSWNAPAVPAELPQSVTWDGMVGGRVQPAGRYAFRVAAIAPGGVRAVSAQTPPQAPDPAAFQFLSHEFPVRGPHGYGEFAARFGGGRGHQGQDVFAACGTPLWAARGGVVKFKQYHSRAGHYIVIDGEKTGVDYGYMHMREAALVDEGDRVRTGQLIGYVGKTGRASGCHLHFEMWTAPGWYDGGSPFDPLPSLLAWDKTS